MAIFKHKINIDEFIGLLLVYGFKLFETQSDFLLSTVDESDVLSESDITNLKELSGTLVAVNLVVGEHIYLSDKISHDEFSELLAKLYVKFLEEVKTLDKIEINKKADQFGVLLNSWVQLQKVLLEGGSNEKESLYPYITVDDYLKYVLCYAFAEFYSKVKKKNIIAFKFAQYFVKNDMMREFLKEYKVSFKS